MRPVFFSSEWERGVRPRKLLFAVGLEFFRVRQEVNVKRELDSLVTQMHSSGVRYDEAVREFKKQYLREVLVAHRGNQCKAAEELGMHRNTLSRVMAELGLDLAEVRAELKRPPRSERPVFSTPRQGYRQG